MLHYELVISQDLDKFQQVVSHLLNDGWRCQGGVAVIVDKIGTSKMVNQKTGYESEPKDLLRRTWAQAMTKDDRPGVL